MAKLTSTSLLFLFAALIGYYAFAAPLLPRNIDQLESDLELFFGDAAILSNAIASYNYPGRIRPVSNFHLLEQIQSKPLFHSKLRLSPPSSPLPTAISNSASMILT